MRMLAAANRWRAERRAAVGHEGATRGPWPVPSRETRLALVASKPAQAGSEPRHSLPPGDWATYSSAEGLK